MMTLEATLEVRSGRVPASSGVLRNEDLDSKLMSPFLVPTMTTTVSN